MADKDLSDFPDISKKVAAPTKKSIFERQKAEAEAKRVRDQVEAAAIYDDFVKSFEDDGSAPPEIPEGPRRSGPGSLGPPPSAPTGPGRRHFGLGMKKSGPGTLGPPQATKREYDEDWHQHQGMFAYGDTPSYGRNAATAFKTEDEDEKKDLKAAERAASRPTLQLTLLPPGTSAAVIKSLLPSNLTVEGVRIGGLGSGQSTERKSMSAIVTLSPDTPASDIDAAVSALQNKYLGWGFNLSLSRHLSSSVVGRTDMSAKSASSLTSQPFGARMKQSGPPTASLGRAPPPAGMHRGGYAPPTSYEQNAYAQQGRFEVQVTPPSDIRELKLIHKTVEAVLKHGAEFEALLMTRPEVQRDVKWAWLWDTRSPGGTWYRWRLYQISAGKPSQSRLGIAGISHRVFESGAPWIEPEINLRFEFATGLPELISDSDYDSSEEDESDDDDNPRKRRRQMMHGNGPPPKDVLNNAGVEEQSYLNPLQRAKLTHLLSRLPTTTARLRKGDVARITAFAISHASQGAAEVVDMLVSNILRPFAWSKHANPEVSSLSSDSNTPMPEANDQPDSDKPSMLQTPQPQAQLDTTPSTLIALYLLSDILSASSTSGVRHAWRYRSLFESALLNRQIFPWLGRLEIELGWGRLRAEKWKRSITGLLSLWEGWGVFMGTTHKTFADEFEKPPVTEKEKVEEAKRVEEEGKKRGKKGWKAVDSGVTPVVEDRRGEDPDAVMKDSDLQKVKIEQPQDVAAGSTTSKVATPRDQLQKVAAQPNHTSSAASPLPPKVVPPTPPPIQAPASSMPQAAQTQSQQQPRRKRMRAEDMFAESDGE